MFKEDPHVIVLGLGREDWLDCGGRRHRSNRMGKMGSPFRQADDDVLEGHLVPSSSGIPRTEVDDVTSLMRAGAKVSQYSHISVSDQARQQIGDNFYAPVTFQHVAATPVTTTVPVKGSGREGLMESLEFNEMDARFVDVHPNLVGTCEWLPETPEYKSWMDPELMSTHHGFFWIKGKAGAGKSTLMKHASTYAEARCSPRQHILNFFFHARGGLLETSTDGLFRSLLHQLLEKVPAVFNSLNKRRLGLAKRQGWSSTLLKDAFREAVLSLNQEQVTCYVDAMDECHENDIDVIIQYFDNLGDAVVAEGKRFYVCLSSRLYPNLRSSKSVELVLEDQDGHDEDLQQYIHQRLLIDRMELKRDLAEAIRSKAYGIFLWVVLVVALVNQDDRYGNAAEIYQRLDRIPTELSDLFNELIGRGTNSNHFRPLLQWVAFNTRDLQPKDLYCILMNDIVKTDLKPPTLDEKDLAKFILSASKGLAEITAGPWPRVQFIHESLRTYFLGDGVVHLIDSTVIDRVRNDIIRSGAQECVAMTAHCHDQLKERCLAYIMQVITVINSLWLTPGVTWGKPDKSQTYRSINPELDVQTQFERMFLDEQKMERFGRISTAYPFIAHAVIGVMEHANTALDLGLAQYAFIDALPGRELNILRTMLSVYFRVEYETFHSEPWNSEPSNSEPRNKALAAASSGCLKLLKAVLEIHTPFEANSLQWGIIICAFIDKDDDEGVSIALQAGADPNAPSSRTSGSCIEYAVCRGAERRSVDRPIGVRYWRIIELLIEHGARSYATIERTSDLLYQACWKHDLKLVRILLGQRPRADTQCSHYGISLARAVGKASRDGNDDMLRFLLDKGAETGWWSGGTLKTNGDGVTFFEVQFGDLSILRTILKERPQSLPPTGATLRAVAWGIWESPADLTIQFKQ